MGSIQSALDTVRFIQKESCFGTTRLPLYLYGFDPVQPQPVQKVNFFNFFNFFVTFFYSMVEIESFFFELSISTVYYYCIKCT